MGSLNLQNRCLQVSETVKKKPKNNLRATAFVFGQMTDSKWMRLLQKHPPVDLAVAILGKNRS